MRLIIKTALIAILSYFAGLYFPFWSLAIVAFVVSIIIKTNTSSSFFAGFIAVFLVWGLLAYFADQETQSILTNRVASIFMGIPNIALIVITGVIGGLVGGLGAASGASLVGLRSGRKRRQQKYYS